MRNTYQIPQNIMKSGKVFNGTLDLRNVVEGVILALVGVFICQFIHVQSDKRITLYILICAPLGGAGIIGVKGDPLSVFIRNFFKWLKRRKPYIHNPHGRAYDKRTADIMMEETQLRDVIGGAVDKIKDRFVDNKVYVEGENYQFATDPEWTYLESGNEQENAEEEISKDAEPQETPSLDLHDLMNSSFNTDK